MPTLTNDARTQRLIDAYEALDRTRLPALLALYGDDAHFKDPFNDVRGVESIERIFTHMFDALASPRFVVTHAVSEGVSACLTWEFHFRRNVTAAPMCILGATHLVFDSDGRIALHRDYWDTAEELYAKLPGLGAVVRWLQRKLSTPQRLGTRQGQASLRCAEAPRRRNRPASDADRAMSTRRGRPGARPACRSSARSTPWRCR